MYACFHTNLIYNLAKKGIRYSSPENVILHIHKAVALEKKNQLFFFPKRVLRSIFLRAAKECFYQLISLISCDPSLIGQREFINYTA